MLPSLLLPPADRDVGGDPEFPFLPHSSCGLQGTAAQGARLSQGQEWWHTSSCFQSLLLGQYPPQCPLLDRSRHWKGEPARHCCCPQPNPSLHAAAPWSPSWSGAGEGARVPPVLGPSPFPLCLHLLGTAVVTGTHHSSFQHLFLASRDHNGKQQIQKEETCLLLPLPPQHLHGFSL